LRIRNTVIFGGVGEGELLVALADAAEDDGGADAEVLAVGGEALADLRGELAGRGEDQGPDGAAAAASIPVAAGGGRGRREALGRGGGAGGRAAGGAPGAGAE